MGIKTTVVRGIRRFLKKRFIRSYIERKVTRMEEVTSGDLGLVTKEAETTIYNPLFYIFSSSNEKSPHMIPGYALLKFNCKTKQ